MTTETPDQGSDSPDSVESAPARQDTSSAMDGGASVSDEGAPIGFGATVGGAEPGVTSDPREAADLNNAPEAPATDAAER